VFHLPLSSGWTSADSHRTWFGITSCRIKNEILISRRHLRVIFSCLAVDRFQCCLHQCLLCANYSLAIGWRLLVVAPICIHYPPIPVVCEDELEVSFQLSTEFGIRNRCHGFDSLVEVSGHPVGTPQIVLRIATVFEIVNSGMFEEVANK